MLCCKWDKIGISGNQLRGPPGVHSGTPNVFYINDVINYLPSIKTSLYADDTVSYLGGTNIHTLNAQMQKAAKNFRTWCQLLT